MKVTSKISLIVFLVALVGAGASLLTSLWLHRAGPSTRTSSLAETRSLGSISVDERLLIDISLSIIGKYYYDAKRSLAPKTLRSFFEKVANTFDISCEYKESVVTVMRSTGQEQRFDLSKPESVRAVIFALVAEANASTKRSGSDSNAFRIVNSFAKSHDLHTGLLSREEYIELKEGTEGSYGGLGILVGMREKLLTVIRPIAGTPASRAGIQSNDKILTINGQETFGYTLSDLIEFMRGAPGSLVRLSLLRSGQQSPLEIKLKREVIEVDPVSSEYVVSPEGHRVAWIRLESFSMKAFAGVLDELKKVKESIAEPKGAGGLVLDLRGNPGGLLDQALKISDLFVDKGTIITIDGRRQEKEEASPVHLELDLPTIVLIDANSASASEILAGALQDHHKAIVVGQRSFGKGTVQTVFELPGDRALKLTIAHYQTPSGRSIQDVGIVPDIWLQPIYKRANNINLFGNNTFKTRNVGLLARADVYSKGFILREARGEYSPSADGNSDELKTALAIIDHVHKGSSPGDFDASMRSMIAKRSKLATNYIQKHHGIVWGATENLAKAGDYRLSIVLEKPERRRIRPGEELEFSYVVSNLTKDAIDRVSVFVQAEAQRLGLETLVGRLEGKKSKSGTIKFLVPPMAMVDGSLHLTHGVAIDGFALSDSVNFSSFSIQDYKDPLIALTGELVGEHGGKVSGFLEANEQAKVLLRLRNHSPHAVALNNIRIFNLSGQQLKLGKVDEAALTLQPRAESLVHVEVSGSANLVSSELGIGVSVESGDLNLGLNKTVKIPAIPTLGKEN